MDGLRSFFCEILKYKTEYIFDISTYKTCIYDCAMVTENEVLDIKPVLCVHDKYQMITIKTKNGLIALNKKRLLDIQLEIHQYIKFEEAIT